MIISSTLVEFHNFFVFVDVNSKIFFSISISFEFWKFWSNNMKMLATDEEVNIEVS